MTVLAERLTIRPAGHAESLTPNVPGALSDSAVSMPDLGAVVVGCGPGPFTGLRVGMATAAAFGHALDIPVFGVCSLDGSAGTTGEVLVVTDARRRELYWARYRDGVRVSGPGSTRPPTCPAAGASAVAGSAPHARCSGCRCWARSTRRPSLRGGRAGSGTAAPEPLVPLYLRRPDAKTLAERGSRGERHRERRVDG